MNARWITLMYTLFLIVYQTALPQSAVRLEGKILDARYGTPVAGAIVSLDHTAFQAQADDEGVFVLENVPPGEYQLLVERVGFEKKQISHVMVRPDVPTHLVIQLKPEPLTLQEILVEASPEKVQEETPSTVVIPYTEIQKFAEAGVSTILHQIPGIQVESPDGSGEHLRIRIHGSKANQVLVLLDGQRLNNPQTGEVDLSVIPLESIERIEVIPHGYSARYGSNAYAGVIAFITRKTRSKTGVAVKGKVGSFKTATGSVDAVVDRQPLQFLINYHQSYSLQNFPYGYQGKVWLRQNAWSRYRKLFLKGRFQTLRHRISVSFQDRQGRRGLPSPYFNNYRDYGAFASEIWRMGQVFHQYFLNANGLWQTRIAMHQLIQTFTNTRDPSPFTRYHTRNHNQTMEIETHGEFTLPDGLQLTGGFQFLEEQLQQDNLLYPQYSIELQRRQSRSAFVTARASWDSVPLLKLLQIQGAFRIEKYFNLPSKGYPFFAISLIPEKWPSLSLSISWQRSVRYPDFNSLFWKGDARARGNPNLQPEQKTGTTGVLHWRTAFFYLSLQYFREQLTDLIYWNRGVNGVWEPRNLRRAFKEGLDVSLQIPFWKNHGSLQLAYNWINALNTTPEPNTYRKQIVFTPRHTLNATLQIGIGPLWGTVFFRYVGERQTVPANSPGTALLPYRIWDARLTYQHAVGSLQVQVGVSVQNIFNEDYQLIFGFPMPRRGIFGTLHLKWTHQ